MLASTAPEACLAITPVSRATSWSPYWNVLTTLVTVGSSDVLVAGRPARAGAGQDDVWPGMRKRGMKTGTCAGRAVRSATCTARHRAISGSRAACGDD